MTTIGVRKLKNQATEVVREVREQQVEYVVTYRGKPVALISPYTPPSPKRRSVKAKRNTWRELDWLRQEIGRQWKTDLTAVEAVAEQRR